MQWHTHFKLMLGTVGSVGLIIDSDAAESLSALEPLSTYGNLTTCSMKVQGLSLLLLHIESAGLS